MSDSLAAQHALVSDGSLETRPGTRYQRHVVHSKGKAPIVRKLPPTTDSEESASDTAGPRNARITWSDDEDSDRAYQDFKKRKSSKRKRGRKKKGDETTGVKGGRAPSAGSPAGNEAAEDDESGPDFVRKRRARFDERRRILKDAALKLPPTYEEIDFSEDDRPGTLAEKPVFTAIRPVAPYKDIELPFSLGLIPASIAQWLRDYQVEGVEFLHRLFVYQAGGILGDDMGLGKTVQVIAFLNAAFGKTGDERDAKRMRKMRRADAEWYPRVLVVCPGSLIRNWMDELERWGYWHFGVYHGNEKESILQTAASGRLEIVITTYTTYRMNKDMVNSVEWDCVIADECHQIKGFSSETSRAMNEVNALCRIGLTGTAIQNTYEELWVLLNWTSPGRLGPISEWSKSISEPLRVGQSHEATLHQLGMARKVARSLVENLLPRFFLRRMKSLIADQLPKKTDRVVFCPLTNTSAKAYKAFLASDVVDYIRTSSDPCPCGSGKKRGWCCYQEVPGGSRWQNYVFPAIVNLQKLANHIAILIPQGNDPVEKQEKDLVMLKAALPDEWRRLYETRGSILHYSNNEFCGKWKVLKKLLKFWHDHNDKVLIFSHNVRLLKMLKALFTNTAYNVSYLDGSMHYEARAKAVVDYNADPHQFVFLISTKAGGVGLNITSANKVVIVDPNWNPAWDLQAQDRAYRIGQMRDVEVFRLVSAGTIEEIVYARQIYKQQQAAIGYTASTERRYFRGVQHSDSRGEIFGLKNLFGYAGDATQSVLQDIVNQTNVAESRAGVSVVGLDVDSTQEISGVADPLLAGRSEDSAMANLAETIKRQTPGEGDGGDGATDDDGAEAGHGRGAGRHGRKTPRPLAARTVPEKKSDPIQAILAGAGVGYTHDNSEVVGTSRVEARLSRRAEAQGNQVGFGEQRLFRTSQESNHRPGAFHRLVERDVVPTSDRAVALLAEDGAGDGAVGGSALHRRYHPSEEIRRRHFCSMARAFGFESAVDFGFVVEGWTPEQRKEALDTFYAGRSAKLERGGTSGGTGRIGTGGEVKRERREGMDASVPGEIKRNGGVKWKREGSTERIDVKREETKIEIGSDESTASEGEDGVGAEHTVTAKVFVKEPTSDVDLDESTASEGEAGSSKGVQLDTAQKTDGEVWEL